MRVGRAGMAALSAAAVVAGLAWPTALSAGPAGAASATAEVTAVSPAPGDAFATPQTTISFLGISRAALGTVRVSGSRSGPHPGALVADPDGATIFKPRHAFLPGERVTVRTGALIPGVRGHSFSFTVAHVAAGAPEVLPPGSGTGPRATVSLSGAVTSPRGSRLAGTCKPALIRFRSEPGLLPPGACVNQAASGTAPGYLFTTPAPHGHRGTGAAIFDNSGNLVWYDPVDAPMVHNLEPVTYKGQPMLAFYQGTAQGGPGHGTGEYVLMNEQYQVVSYIRAGNGDQADLHDLTITPQNTALIGAYVPVTMDLTADGGTANQVVYDYVVQEIDVATGNVLFSWSSLDHVPVTDSDYPVPTDGSAFDYFHGNSISLTSDGNLLVSGRNVSAVYDINRSTGAVVWQLGGKQSTFTLAPAGQQWFCYQHHVRETAANVITIFDDGGIGPATCPNHASRALTLSLDTTANTATITVSLSHQPPLSAGFLGSNQLLPNGGTLVSWGNTGQITEFSAAGKPDFDMSLSGFTYRTFRVPWTGTPTYRPAVATRRGPGTRVRVYASWNGDTQVASWQVLAGRSLSSLRPVGRRKAKKGFETRITVHTSARVVAAQALDSSGKALAVSAAVPTRYTPAQHGYYLATQGGGVYNFSAPFRGSLTASGRTPRGTVVGAVVPPAGGGYYLASSGGKVYSFGVPSFGSHRKTSSPMVGLGAYGNTGYYLVTADGRLYHYGKAPFYGSPHSRGTKLSAPVSGIAVDPKGGYWLVTQDGGVLNYGAPFYGSERGKTLSGPVVGIAAEPGGDGYLLVTSTGSVYHFGRAPWHGSPASSVVNLSSPVVGIATEQPIGAEQQPTGYYVVCANGDVYNYGVALPGSPNGLALPTPIAGVATR